MACSQLEVHSLQRELHARPSQADFDTLANKFDQLRRKMLVISDIAETQTDELCIHEDLLNRQQLEPEMQDRGTEAVTLPTSESATQTAMTAIIESVIVNEPKILDISDNLSTGEPTATDDLKDVDIAMPNDSDGQSEEKLVEFQGENNSLMMNSQTWWMLACVLLHFALIFNLILQYLTKKQ